MSVIAFWNNGKEQVGKTLSIVAIATYMAIEHNYKILIVSTSYKNKTIDNCYWTKDEVKKKKSLGLFGPNTNVYMGNGMDGIIPMMRSKKLTPELITNYTKIIFKDRLEVLPSFTGNEDDYKEATNMYPDIISQANRYYDLVFVDLDESIGEENVNAILNHSTMIMATLSQRLTCIDSFMKKQEEDEIFKSPKVLVLIGRYDRYSKYTLKNITRYMKEKNKISTVPYNTLFFEASEEATVPDLFLRFRKIKDEDDRNYLFMTELKRCSENIIYRLQDLKMQI